MRKKIILVPLLATIVAGGLTACGGDNEPAAPTSTVTDSQDEIKQLGAAPNTGPACEEMDWEYSTVQINDHFSWQPTVAKCLD